MTTPARSVARTPAGRRYGKSEDGVSSMRRTPGSALRVRGSKLMATPGSMRKEATPGGVSRFALTSLSPSHEARRNLAGRFDEDEDEDDEANVSWSSVETAEPVHEIVNQLQSDFTNTISEAADKLQLMAIEADEGQRNELAASGAPSKLVALVQSGAPIDDVIGALQNFAASANVDDSVKAELVEAGVIPTLLGVLKGGGVPASAMVSAIAVMLNLAIGCEARKLLIVQHGAIPLIAPLVLPEMAHHAVELQSSAMRALTSLSIGSEDRKHEITTCVNLAGVMACLDADSTPELWQPALALIQSLVFCNDARKRAVLELGFIAKASLLLASGTLTAEVEDMVTKLLVGFASFQGTMAKESSSTAAAPSAAGGGAIAVEGVVGAVGGAMSAVGSAFTWLIVGDDDDDAS